jgi:ABC-type phosphate transport system permease subunit
VAVSILLAIVIILGVLLGVYIKKYARVSEELSNALAANERLQKANDILNSNPPSFDDIAEWLS